MKTLIVLLMALSLSACSHHSFMDNAVVGTVDGERNVVMFYDHKANGVEYYRPQFQSDCPVNKAYSMDNASTGCMISERRITNLQSYKDNKAMPTIRSHSFNHDYIEDVNAASIAPDNI